MGYALPVGEEGKRLLPMLPAAYACGFSGAIQLRKQNIFSGNLFKNIVVQRCGGAYTQAAAYILRQLPLGHKYDSV
jgi:hypothetical protein